MAEISDFVTRPERTVEAFTREFLENLRYVRGVDLSATPNDHYQALGYTIRQYLMQDWLDTANNHFQSGSKSVIYLSAEYLPGRQLDNALLNTGLEKIARESMANLGLDFDLLSEVEIEPGLGNGGLGRLAACFLDSMATLNIPAIGYGIRYEYGIFRQTFIDGWQVEQPDPWLRLGNPWEFPHPDLAVVVGFEGYSEQSVDEQGRFRVQWRPSRRVLGVPYNIMVPGYGTSTVNTLRLWRARATQAFDLRIFNAGDFAHAVEEKTASENLTKVLYPDDSTPQGKQLRLEQEYFFVACSLRDMLRFLPNDFDLKRLPDRVAIQLNDTHPTIAIAELMRILIDERFYPWEQAWTICTGVFAFTSHTLLPEAQEVWPVSLLTRLLPRHMEIINEINRRFLSQVRTRFPGDEERVRRMSIVSDGENPQVRMAHLATVGSFKVNGVAPIQSDLLKGRVLNDFADLWPRKFTNVTNGVTPRRFIKLANPDLAALVSATIGKGWLNDLDRLQELEQYAEDPVFQEKWREVKAGNKARLAPIIHDSTGVDVPTDAMYDIMVKRIHEYKRQLLKALHVITLYDRLRQDDAVAIVPRVVTFGGKSAPGYQMAKLIIRLINGIAEVVNADPVTEGRLRLVYPPNFNVTLAEPIYAGADISEQISLAGKEASGTGNMKFSMNGAVTTGTLDGANIDIRERVGPENFFLFGMTVEEVLALQARGYHPEEFIQRDAALKSAIDQIAAGVFSRGDTALFRPIVDSLYQSDPFMVAADFTSYVEAQDAAEAAYRDLPRWTKMSIMNVARSGYFSSDRSIRDYSRNIWKVAPVVGGEPGEPAQPKLAKRT